MDYKISDYGIKGNETKVQTALLQSVIDTCSDNGGGKVIFQPGIYLSGTLVLKSGVILWLEKGAVLAGSENIEDYPENETCFIDAVGHKRGRSFLYAYDIEEIGIGGEGCIDGRGYLFPPEHEHHMERPFLVRMANCNHIKLEGACFRQSAAWGIHLLECNHVAIDGITVINRCNGNNDGIDIDGCKNVEISNSFIDCGDDALCLKSTTGKACEKIRIHDCTVTTDWAGFKIGTESVGDFVDIEVWNCRFFDINGCGIKIVPVDGGNVSNLYLHDIQMLCCTGPIFISTGERLRKYFSEGRRIPGRITDLRIERIEADVIRAKGSIYQNEPWGNAAGSIVISGLKEFPAEKIVMKDCKFYMPGGVEEYVPKEVPEMGMRYPEFHMFDVLPTCGIYLRHGDKIHIENIDIHLKNPDCRPEYRKEDVSGLTMEKVRLV